MNLFELLREEIRRHLSASPNANTANFTRGRIRIHPASLAAATATLMQDANQFGTDQQSMSFLYMGITWRFEPDRAMPLDCILATPE